MRKTLSGIPFSLTIGVIALLSASAYANEQRGKDLHDANCMSCHTSLMGGDPNKIYSRADRRVNSLSGLKNQVTRCKTTVGVDWPEDQINDVVEYLNHNFYHIK
jgi:mono/diheme cytochrome c family protein